MKILSIESPQMLKDGTVKAAVTVTEDDYIPLISLLKDARKGAEIELDVRKSDNEPDNYYFTLASQITRELAERLENEFKRGTKVGYEDGIESTKPDPKQSNATAIISDGDADIVTKQAVAYGFPERQADVVKAHDQIEDNKSPYAPATDRY